MTSTQAGKVVLYSYWRSTCSWRARIALAMKGIEYEYIPINLLQGQQKTEDYLKINPFGQVPTLYIDGHYLSQSLAIVEYLEETRSNQGLSYLPRDPFQRALVREVSQMIACGTQPLQNLGVLAKIGQDYGEAEKKKWAQHWIKAGLDALEKKLKMIHSNGQYCVGGSATMADICLIPQLYNSRRFEVDLSPYPTLLSIEAHCSSLPYFQKAHPDQQPDAVKQ